MANPPVDFRLLAGAGVPARDFKAGDVIFREGEPAQDLFIIQSGEVEIRVSAIGSSKRCLNTAFLAKWLSSITRRAARLRSPSALSSSLPVSEK